MEWPHLFPQFLSLLVLDFSFCFDCDDMVLEGLVCEQKATIHAMALLMLLMPTHSRSDHLPRLTCECVKIC
jgi:hypothetical protein